MVTIVEQINIPIMSHSYPFLVLVAGGAKIYSFSRNPTLYLIVQLYKLYSSMLCTRSLVSFILYICCFASSYLHLPLFSSHPLRPTPVMITTALFCVSVYLSFILLSFFKIPQINEIMQYFSFCIWIISLLFHCYGIMSSRFIHVLANGKISFLKYIYTTQFLYLSVP